MTTARERVVTTLTSEMPGIVGRTVDAIQVAIPAYRDLRGAQLVDVEGIAHWSLMRLMQLWSAGADFEERDRARFRAIGSARATDGRPLTDILRAYRVASSVFVRHVAEECLDDLDPVDIAELSLLVLGAVDAISEELMDAYTVTRERLTSDRGHAQSALLDDLIAGRQSSRGALADRTRELDLALASHPQLLVLAHTDPATPVSDADLDTVAVALGLIPHTRRDEPDQRTHLSTRRGPRGVFLLPPTIERQRVESICRTEDLRGCLIVGRSITEVSGTYRLATDALDAAPAHAFVERALLDDGDGYLLALLTARPTANSDALIAAVLGPLLEPSNQHLLEGLSAFIATGTATGAAAALHIHPQTLRYRLRRANELTGRDPRQAWHRLALDTAIQLQHLAVPHDSASPAARR